MYRDVDLNCLSRCEGDYQRAMHFQDCSWFEYYWRISIHKEYSKLVKDEFDKAMKKTKR